MKPVETGLNSLSRRNRLNPVWADETGLTGLFATGFSKISLKLLVRLFVILQEDDPMIGASYSLNGHHDDVDQGDVVHGPGDVLGLVEVGLCVPNRVAHFDAPNEEHEFGCQFPNQIHHHRHCNRKFVIEIYYLYKYYRP